MTEGAVRQNGRLS